MIQEGWKCPVCGTIYAPWVSECRKCNQGIKKPVSVPFGNPPIKPYIGDTPEEQRPTTGDDSSGTIIGC